MSEKQERPVLDQETKDKITTARVDLYTHFPFFAHLAQYLSANASWLVPTAGVTANNQLFINPKFAKKCNVSDMIAILAHEVMHLVTATCAREPEGAHPEAWNWATDIAINYLLFNKEHGAGMDLPREEVIRPLFGGEFAKYDGWPAEDIYYDLIKEHKNKCPHCGKGEDGQGKGDNQDGGQSPGQRPGPLFLSDDQESGA